MRLLNNFIEIRQLLHFKRCRKRSNGNSQTLYLTLQCQKKKKKKNHTDVKKKTTDLKPK